MGRTGCVEGSRRPPIDLRSRQVEAGNVVRAGPGRDERYRRALPNGVPEHQLGRGRGRGASRRATFARVSTHSVASSGRRRLRIVDRVHERRQPSARALDVTTTRDCDLLRARSEPDKAHPTSAHGESRARRARRSCRSGDGQWGALLDPVDDAVRRAAFGASDVEPARSRLRPGYLDSYRNRLRVGARGCRVTRPSQ